MTYAILWISHVGFGLLLVAAVTAIASRCKRILERRSVPISAAIFIFISFVPLMYVVYQLVTNNHQPKWLFWYSLSEIIVYTIGVIIILIRGLKGSSGDEQKAKSWPRAWLATLAGMALFVFTTTMNIADMRLMDHLSGIKHSATSNIRDMLPAKLPKSLNAHFVYEEAAQAFPQQKKGLPKWFDKSGDPGFDLSVPEVQGFISAHNDVLKIMRKAKNIPGYRLEVNTSFFVASPIPEYHHYRNIARFIGLYARTIAEGGNLGSALDELEIIKSMADHLRNFPQFLSFIVSLQFENIQYRALEYILAQKFAPHGNFVDLPINARSSVREDFLASLRMEAQDHIQSAAENFSHLNDFLMFTFESKLSTSTSVSQTLEGTFFRVFLGPSEIRAVTDIIGYWMSKEANTYEAFKGNMNAISDAQKSGEMGLFSFIYCPDYSYYIPRAMKCDVHRGLCDLALAITAFRARNNAYPAKLEELVPEFIDCIPMDPFGGKPLKMKSVDGGLDLYSAGAEKEDGKQKKVEPIHFYLGKDAYEKFRVKPALEEKREQVQTKSERKRDKK